VGGALHLALRIGQRKINHREPILAVQAENAAASANPDLFIGISC
jgi:hypothetical protein